MEDSVPESVKEERNQILLDDLSKRIVKRLESMVGSTVTVLAEGVSARNEKRWVGRTDNNIVVHFEPDDTVVSGTLRQVKVTRFGGVTLFGDLL